MVDESIINLVIRKFLTSPRQPKYLNKPEYAHLYERNKEFYLSSAYFKSSYAWGKLKSYIANFFDDTKKYFACGLNYTLSMKEGLLSREQVIDDRSENDFDELAFMMEMECMWIGDDGDNLFRFDEIEKRRKIKNAFYPLRFYNDRITVPQRAALEKRILSLDVALMRSTKKKKNDAAALFINSCIQKDQTSYQSNIVYGETFEGLTTDELGLIAMRYFYKYKCTDFVLDANGRLMPPLSVMAK